MFAKDHKDLIVWQKSMDLLVEVYHLVKKLPKEETYALSDQMRRAVVSIPSNIAEGRGRSSEKDFLRFLFIARGSRAEIETQLLVCLRLNYLSESELETALNLSSEISSMLNSMINKLSLKLKA
ncbi:MAG: four helix bundle protein [Selenomonadaceae bacterium]|nr:four helix bundle protein [Selenomonadaceae bacterium]